MPDRWYYAWEGKRQGPVDGRTLLALLRQGRLRPTDMVLREGAQRWVPLGTLLVPRRRPAAPPEPPVPAETAAGPVPRSGWFRRAAGAVLGEIPRALHAAAGQAARLLAYAWCARRTARLAAAARQAQVRLGERLARHGLGDPGLRRQCDLLEDKIQMNRSDRRAVRDARHERDEVLLQLAAPFLRAADAPAGLEQEHRRAADALEDRDRQEARRARARQSLVPASLADRGRTAAGVAFATLVPAGALLLALALGSRLLPGDRSALPPGMPAAGGAGAPNQPRIAARPPGPGMPGREVPAYPLALSPPAIYGRLAREQPFGPAGTSDDEAKLLAQVWDQLGAGPQSGSAGLDADLYLEALLVASGVDTAAARAAYRARFDQVLAGARRAVADAADDPYLRGSRLLDFLHAEVLHAGYSLDQACFAAALDTGRYNCLSSTAVYYLLGTYLGLDLRVISFVGNGAEPGHVSLDLVAGDRRIEIEPTNPHGFDRQAKLRESQEIIPPSGFVPDRKDGREESGPWLVGATFGNRLLWAGKRGPVAPLDEVRCALWMLAVNPGESKAADQVLAHLNNTGNRLVEAQRPDAAVAVLTLGTAAAPANADLANNLGRAYDAWARGLGDRGQWREALDRYREGVRALNGHAPLQEKLMHNALALVDARAQPSLQANDWDEAGRVYETGLTYFPGNPRLQERLAQVRERKAGTAGLP